MRGQRYHEGMIVELTPGDVRVLLPWLKYSNTAVRDVSPNNTVLAVLQYIDFNLRLGETGISAAAAGTLNTRNPVSRLVGFWRAADGEMYIAISPKTVFTHDRFPLLWRPRETQILVANDLLLQVFIRDVELELVDQNFQNLHV